MNHCEEARSRKSVLGVLLFLFGAAAISVAWSTGPERLADTYKVVIFQKGANTCFYRLDDANDNKLANQDTLKVHPSDRLMFIAQEVDVSVNATANKKDGDPNNGLRAFSGSPRNSNFFLDDTDGRTKTVNVRTNNGNSKRHHSIEINCLVGDVDVPAMDTDSGPFVDGVAIVRAIPALPWPGLDETGEIILPDLNRLPDLPLRGEGGPDMEVDP